MRTVKMMLFFAAILLAVLACDDPPVATPDPVAGLSMPTEMAVEIEPANTPIPTATARPVQLADVVDQEKTDPRLYTEWEFFTYDGDRFEPVHSTVVPQMPTEVLYGMLRCAEGAAGTSIWRFLDPSMGDFYIFIWDAGVAEGGFAYVNGEGGIVSQGMNAPIYEISDLLSWMKNDGWKEIKPSKLPSNVNARAIQDVIRSLPASLPLWQAPMNLFLMIFPQAMIYFQYPHDAGGA